MRCFRLAAPVDAVWEPMSLREWAAGDVELCVRQLPRGTFGHAGRPNQAATTG